MDIQNAITMKKIFSYICAIGAGIVSLVLLFFSLTNRDIPVLLWLAFALCEFAYVALSYKSEKRIYF